MTKKPTFKKAGAAPFILILLILGGLLTALLATSVWQALFQIALVIPLVVITWKLLKAE
ncbi:hypothetical protein SAMN05660461_2410 [Chitinophaga ginsengisegetis]|uniref:Uncharacterized protein n=1 Tax=Chitinophaga ginsengisegetis TaxID=393003 RepID=A0A1T5NPS2_9BACT|nr:hypothetical protein [Chitinophaga ginsengisegetis]MDR6565587.1 fatty acid desaturase [Chitinophaga ginsengisegetis]MDR6645316.1 fatty acid desaturase [Chitinophaga ginsengisegetis]MDR6652093.1 fatty acid desaturase [Chitinophaga ginsengisegetis]SKD02089.1 hypothetical protein SAMN05660461_2410 [Chitinophaga ginsengisegetis]